MAAVIDTIRSAHASALFLDVSENQNLAHQIASESGAKVITDLYIETLSPTAGPASTYIDMLRHDVTVIVNALR
jgi:zinc/manganese transport system substrate-binding protein